MCYVKLLDRLCRHLVFASVRKDNLAASLVKSVRWSPAEGLAGLRGRAIVALFLATDITAVEARSARVVGSPPQCEPPCNPWNIHEDAPFFQHLSTVGLGLAGA